MAYVALYRAYRPQSFKEVSGQEHIVKTLQNAIIKNKVAHAYLFSGPRGTGKTTIAKIMAKAINCPNSKDGEPCNECEICKGITKGMIPDVVEIDAASNNGVDEIREIRDKVKYMPSEGKYKVYIIDEVHMLSTGAFNALLKTLEEPPVHAIFILATTEAQKIPATILSRCQRFDFRGISEKEIEDRIIHITKSEKINIESDAVTLIAQCAEGGMRDALSLLDEAISFAGEKVTANDVYQVSGSVNFENIINLTNSILEKDPAKVLNSLEEIIDLGKEIPKICSDLIAFYRDVLIFKNNPRENQSFKDEFKTIAKKISNNKVYFYLNALNEAQNNMKFTNQKRTYLELALVKMSDYNEQVTIDNHDDIVKLENRIKELEGKLASNYTKNIGQNIEYVKEENVVLNKNNAEFNYIEIRHIEEVLNNGDVAKKKAVQQRIANLSNENIDRFLSMTLQDAKVVAASIDKVILTFEKASICDTMMKIENRDKALQLINKNEDLIKEYYAIPEKIWENILFDYKTKFKAGIKKPSLEKIDIGVRLYDYTKTDVVKSEMQEIALEIFGDKVKFEE